VRPVFDSTTAPPLVTTSAAHPASGQCCTGGRAHGAPGIVSGAASALVAETAMIAVTNLSKRMVRTICDGHRSWRQFFVQGRAI
jgi:hypothetical protein